MLNNQTTITKMNYLEVWFELSIYYKGNDKDESFIISS